MKLIYKNWRKFLMEGKIKKTAGLIPISPEGKLLVGMRGKNGSHPLKIASIGGHLEDGETLQNCAKREFKEETGYRGEIGPLVKLGTFVKNDLDFTTFATRFEEEWDDLDPEKDFEEEIEWVRWFFPEDLLKRDDLINSLRDLLEDEEVMVFLKKNNFPT